ncbi:hypothetical protein EBX31_12385, partial [bacterium]|nr:hypothetical protein [bacterium]
MVFKVKGWTTVEGTLNVTSGGVTLTNTVTATMSTAYQTITNTFSNGTAASSIVFATSAKRAFLDDILVTQTGGGG